jgi:hypothetical protein
VKKVFNSLLFGRESARKLLQQDFRSVADYAVDFRTLAAEIAWNCLTRFCMDYRRKLRMS